MDVRQYYRKLREIESGITEPYVLITSLETADGGQPGVVSEVVREQAARQMVEGTATLSSEMETKAFLDKQIAGRRAFEKADMARRLQVTIVAGPDEVAPQSIEPVITSSGVRK